jgi:hypothetical protein
MSMYLTRENSRKRAHIHTNTQSGHLRWYLRHLFLSWLGGAGAEAGGGTRTGNPVLYEWEFVGEECPCCLVELGETLCCVTRKEGKHWFHSRCIGEWLLRSLICPICMVPWTEEACAEQDVVDLVTRMDASMEEQRRRRAEETRASQPKGVKEGPPRS